MRLRRLFASASLVVLLIFLAPPVVAEGVDLRAAGATVGLTKGVAGLQWDEDAGAGVRYWNNGTASFEFVVTVCAVTDSGAIGYCERHPLAP